MDKAARSDREFAETLGKHLLVKRRTEDSRKRTFVFQSWHGEETGRLTFRFRAQADAEPVVEKVREMAGASARDAARQRSDLLAYVFSPRAPADAARRAIDERVTRLGDEDIAVRERATEDLLRQGRSSLAGLPQVRTGDPEVRSRIGAILDRLGRLDGLVARHGLDHDVEFLDGVGAGEGAEFRDRAVERLKSILPAEAEGSAEGWRKVRDRFAWDPARHRFLPASPSSPRE